MTLPRHSHLLPMLCLSFPKLTCSRLDDLVLACITLARNYGVHLRIIGGLVCFKP